MLTEAILLYGDSYHHPAVLWRTGFLAPDPVVYLELDGRGTLLVNAMEFGRARSEARVDSVRTYNDFDFSGLVRNEGERQAYAGMIALLLAEARVQRVRVEPDFPVALARSLEARDVEVLSDAPIFEAERRRKGEVEQAAIRGSMLAAEAGLAVARRMLAAATARDGLLFLEGEPLTSQAVISAIEVELLGHGCAADGTIVAGGERAADPHISDTGHLPADQGVIVDIFPFNKKTRYFGDITRTFVAGDPASAWVDMYETVKAAHAAALARVRAGANGRDVHVAVCATLYEAGFGTLVEGYRRADVPAMIHGTGHGVGLEVHEPPRVSDVDIELVDGDVITIEPGLYSAEHGGVRLEDTVVVTKDGYRNLTDYPMDWTP